MTPADQCNHCAAPIRWVQMPSGKNMPLDLEPDPARGNVVKAGGQWGVLGPRPATAARANGTPLWLPHVVSCPYADRWRNPKPARRPLSRR